MADTYSKLLGLSDSPTPPSDSGKTDPAKTSVQREKKTHLLANQQTSKKAKAHVPDTANKQISIDKNPLVSPPPSPQRNRDTSLLTTKEKAKYGTYLTEESIEKIRIRAIQMKMDDHQVVQEAVNQYFERLKK